MLEEPEQVYFFQYVRNYLPDLDGCWRGNCLQPCCLAPAIEINSRKQPDPVPGDAVQMTAHRHQKQPIMTSEQPEVDTLAAIRSQQIGYLLTVLGVAGFSAKAIFAKLAYAYDVDPITLMTLRSLIAVPLLWLVFALHESGRTRLSRQDWLRMLWAGISGYYLSAYLDFYGLQTVSATLERIILFLYPCFIVLLAALINRRALTAGAWAALAMAYCGVVVTLAGAQSGQLAGKWPGLLLILAAAFIFATYYLIAGTLARKLSAVRFSAYVMSIAGGATLGHFLLLRPAATLFELAPPVYAYAGGLALASTALPILLIAEGLRRIDTSSSATINLFGPVFTAWLAFLILGEQLRPLQWLGFGMVMAGVFALRRPLQSTAGQVQRNVQ